MTLANLINAYLNGTGSVFAYYDFDNTGVIQDGSLYSGAVLNGAPSSYIDNYNGVFQVSGGANQVNAEHVLENAYINSNSGADLSYSMVKFGPIQEIGENDHNTELTFLFSFEKTKSDAGILFGSLVKDSYPDGTPLGRGFNIGINHRNQLFFQGINEDNGEFVLTANEIELSNKNICSVSVSPYNVTIGHYNLSDDQYQDQALFTNGIIQNNISGESYYLGGSNTFYKQGHSFSGYIDKFLMVSGFYAAPDLKSVASGFVATGISSSGVSFTDTIITGHEIILVLRSGVTGFEPVITGYQQTFTDQELIEFQLVENVTPYGREDGEKFITGYSLPSSYGDYIEETAFLIPAKYSTTGDNAYATLGLSNETGLVTRYTIQATKTVQLTGTIPLYEFRPITGVLVDEPVGYEKNYLSGIINKTGTIAESLDYIDGVIHQYKPNYLYYTEKRL